VAVDGSTAVVGAPGANFDQGAVYILTNTAAGWVQTATLTNPSIANPSTANYYFGSSVAIDGATIVVGANSSQGPAAPGAAYVYTRAGANGWPTTPTVTLNDPAATNLDLFGSSVAVDGSTIVVGAPYSPYVSNTYPPHTGPGAAYVYTAGGNGSWPSTPTATLQDPTATNNDAFGTSVAVELNVVAVGAPQTSVPATYLYVQGNGNLWPASPTTTMADPTKTPNDCYGCSVALDEDRTLVVGADVAPVLSQFGYQIGAGAVYIYPWAGGGWSSPTTLTEPGGSSYDDFGSSVAVDNGKLVVGAEYHSEPYSSNPPACYNYQGCPDGMAWEFTKVHGGWPTTPSATFANQLNIGSDSFHSDRFGSSVAVQGNATIIGAWGTFYATYGPYGAAYIFSA
jgi:hypothetical protein